MKINPNNKNYSINTLPLYLEPGDIISNQVFGRVEINLSLEKAQERKDWWNNHFKTSTHIDKDIYYIKYETI